MKSAWKTLTIFGLALALVLTAMGWISILAINLEEAQLKAQRFAEQEENVRASLWRMDSTLTPLILENAKPSFEYRSFYAAGDAYSCMFVRPQEGERLVPSSLLLRTPEHVLVHFQISPSGEFTSPQVPLEFPAGVVEGCSTPETRATARERLQHLEQHLSRAGLLALLPREDADRFAAAGTPALPANVLPVPRGTGSMRQIILKQNDAQMRKLGCSPEAVQQLQNFNSLAPLAAVDVREGPLQPLWVGDLLLLARRVRLNGEEFVQGCWLDWPSIRARLLSMVKDLLPGADLAPALGQDSGEDGLLAALPVRLLPGAVPGSPPGGLSPVRLSLGVAWACVLLAAIAVAALLRGAMTLSARRGAFVSAVTHELRTPLTTFRMYTEMLGEGMVTDEKKRRRYLEKLRSEADRLGHLVENVLGFARLEGGRGASPQNISMDDLLGRMSERLRERAAQAGMELASTADAQSLGEVRANASAVEQILLNLIDNAGKYAGGATDRTVHLEAARRDAGVVLRVRDHGPGVEDDAARRLFQPFSKSDRDAADSAPGVGLGLAFSRQLARDMGGDLRLASTSPRGAAFELILPTR